ncbi:hypothetical protein HZS_6606, partial [Henneguya salminicola]
DVGIYDRVIIQDIIKQSAQTLQLLVIVIVEAERLTKDAQHGLRRTMEKYSESCKIILITESLSSIIEPIQSRCLCVRVSAPKHDQMVNVMEKVCQKENINLPIKLAKRICEESGKNLRRALLMLETCRVMNSSFSDDQNIELPHWQLFIREISQTIIQSQTPEKLMELRSKYYELLSHCIPSDIIMKELLLNLLPFCDDIMKNEGIQLAARYENRIR